jgi:hypothetical protein
MQHKKKTGFTAGMGNVDRTSIGSLAGIDVKMFVGFVAGSVAGFSMGAAIGFAIGTSIATGDATTTRALMGRGT